jgi:hypothetical protein
MTTSRKVGAKLRFGGSVISCQARDNRNRNFLRLQQAFRSEQQDLSTLVIYVRTDLRGLLYELHINSRLR